MNEDIFLQPRLVGPRFEGTAIPLEFLKDLAVLEEMIVEVAKWRFLQDNPGRARSPRGFSDGVQLKLTGVDDGSAKPVIKLFIAANIAANSLFPPQKYYEQARDSIISAIGAAERNTSISEHLPDTALGYFDRMGRSLREGEAMEFTSPTLPALSPPARLTRETRRKLVLAPTTVKEMTEEASVRGHIYEVDQKKKTFRIQLIGGHKVLDIPIPPQHFKVILDASVEYKEGRGARVLLQGVGRFDRKERLQGFESIEHISILEPLDVPARLDELRGLKDGWLEGRGKAPSSDGLNWLAQTFEQNFPDGIPLPFVYPTADGGVQAEWSLGPHEVSLEIDLETHKGQWHCLNMQTDADDSDELSLGDAIGWEWLVAQIRRLAGGEA